MKYDLNLKSDKNVLTFFSSLPPEIRFRTLKKLVEIKGFDNIQLLDKFLLSIVKTRGVDEARFWLIRNHEQIQNMNYPSEEEIAEYEEDFCQDDLPLKLREYTNVYALLMSVINSANVLLADYGLYKNFEEAIVVYKQYDLEFYLSNSEEQQKFKDLLNFCFIGRVSVI